jgi:hypothetical protein
MRRVVAARALAAGESVNLGRIYFVPFSQNQSTNQLHRKGKTNKMVTKQSGAKGLVLIHRAIHAHAEIIPTPDRADIKTILGFPLDANTTSSNHDY